jgi:DhnA family fructose-bisphosphate aldolase class Ia
MLAPMSSTRVILAADHRARGVMTIERYADLLAALRAALPAVDGFMATAQPLRDLVADGSVAPHQSTYLSINRTGLAGSAFELDDRLVASVDAARRGGFTGIKHMTRIDRSDPQSAAALELLGTVIDKAEQAGLDAMIEPLAWRDGAVDRSVDAIVEVAVIAHDMGAPLLKVAVPDLASGSARVDAVRRVVESVGVPVLFLGGPHRGERDGVFAEVRDVMAAGAAGLAIGRALLLDADPAGMAREVAAIVHGAATAG